MLENNLLRGCHPEAQSCKNAPSRKLAIHQVEKRLLTSSFSYFVKVQSGSRYSELFAELILTGAHHVVPGIKRHLADHGAAPLQMLAQERASACSFVPHLLDKTSLDGSGFDVWEGTVRHLWLSWDLQID